jgi:hypothetical protein
MESTNDVSLMTGLGVENNATNTSANKIFHYRRGLEEADTSTPILVLIHGYPQT